MTDTPNKPDPLDDINFLLRVVEDWYARTPGCALPDCLGCKRNSETYTRALLALQNLTGLLHTTIEGLREAQKTYCMTLQAKTPFPQILFVGVDTALRDLGGQRGPLVEEAIKAEAESWGLGEPTKGDPSG